MSEHFFGIFASFLRIYGFILMARALLSWVPGMHSSALAQIIYVLTEPYVQLFRHKKLSRLGSLDLAYVWAWIFLQLLLTIVTQAQMGRPLTLFMVLEIVLFLIASWGQWIILILLAMTVVRLIMYKSTSSRAHQANMLLDAIINPVLQWWKAIIAPKKFMAHNVLLIHVMLLLAVGWVIWGYGFNLLISILR